MLEDTLKHLQNAAHEAAGHMTADLRNSALEHGWHPDVVANMSVRFDKNEFKVHVHPDFEARAQAHEYGTQDSRPTAVIRNFDANNSHRDSLNKSVTKHIKGL